MENIEQIEVNELFDLLKTLINANTVLNQRLEEKRHNRNVILNQIRAEIEEQVLESLSDGGDDWFAADKINECLEIIDKYKSEREN